MPHLDFLSSPSRPTSGAMPSVTQNSPPSVPPAKKRRRDDTDSITATTATINGHSNPHLAFPLSSPSLHNHDPRSLLHGANTPHYHHVHALRKVMPLPAVKRIRTTDVKEDESRQTLAQTKPNSPISQDHGRPASAPPTTTNLTTPTLTKRCHICSRKPTKKSDLDMFADCEGCGQRACFVCMRQCLDWRPAVLREGIKDLSRQKNRESLGAMSTDSFTMEDANYAPDANGPHDQKEDQDSSSKHQQPKDTEGWPARGEHRQMICSKCCIEAGQDGDIICLGCLPYVG
ncbi:hypothetical protein V8F06_002394 [Rhypophila decipiens]